jgi:hypothetical protein
MVKFDGELRHAYHAEGFGQRVYQPDAGNIYEKEAL